MTWQPADGKQIVRAAGKWCSPFPEQEPAPADGAAAVVTEFVKVAEQFIRHEAALILRRRTSPRGRIGHPHRSELQ